MGALTEDDMTKRKTLNGFEDLDMHVRGVEKPQRKRGSFVNPEHRPFEEEHLEHIFTEADLSEIEAQIIKNVSMPSGERLPRVSFGDDLAKVLADTPYDTQPFIPYETDPELQAIITAERAMLTPLEREIADMLVERIADHIMNGDNGGSEYLTLSQGILPPVLDDLRLGPYFEVNPGSAWWDHPNGEPRSGVMHGRWEHMPDPTPRPHAGPVYRGTVQYSKPTDAIGHLKEYAVTIPHAPEGTPPRLYKVEDRWRVVPLDDTTPIELRKVHDQPRSYRLPKLQPIIDAIHEAEKYPLMRERRPPSSYRYPPPMPTPGPDSPACLTCRGVYSHTPEGACSNCGDPNPTSTHTHKEQHTLLIIREPNMDRLQDILSDRREVTFRYGSNKRMVQVTASDAETIIKAHRTQDSLGKRKVEKMVCTSDAEFTKVLGWAKEHLVREEHRIASLRSGS